MLYNLEDLGLFLSLLDQDTWLYFQRRLQYNTFM